MSAGVKLKSGIIVPAIGQGTWKIGDSDYKREQEIEAIRTGIDNGMMLIDTAEMYGDGKSELVVGEAIKVYDRKDIFLVSKVLPENAGRKNMRSSCENSLKRLGTDYLDLYLYHWRGFIPLAETVECLQKLKDEGLIREWGVSNFSTDDMYELGELDLASECAAVQNLYHIGSRGAEFSLKPYLKKKGIAFMAYCPLAINGSLRDNILNNMVLKEIAEAHKATVQQIMLAWSIRDNNTIAIPKSSSANHTLDNSVAMNIKLSNEELYLLDKEFPAPDIEVPLDTQ